MQNHEVVISGVAGTFPECFNFQQFEDKVFTNENLITDDERKWKRGVLNVPQPTGKIKKCFRFDQTFFGVHRRLCTVMDSHSKHSIERTYEAIVDAGINPHEIYGSKVAVVMTSMTSETEYGSVMVSKTSGHAMLGHSRCMQSNRISYFFNFKGPSFALDSSWVGPMQALQIGQNLVSKGHVKMAIVGASNLIFNPEVSVHYDGMGRLSRDGKTRCYSADADGYSRSEGIVVFVIQRADEALRSYGTIVKTVCATEMNYNSIFSDPIGYATFLGEFYSDLNINNSDIAYVEGDGAGSITVDAMELNAISDVLCKGRNKPLPVGSCKSRIGHGESAAAFMSVAHAIIAMKTGYVPLTLHYSEPNPMVPALKDGRIKIPTEKMPLEGDYVAISSIGLSSIYGHTLLKRNPKTRPPLESSYFPKDNLPRILLLSGKDEEGMKDIMKKMENQPVDEYFYSLTHRIFRTNVPKHLFRGYSVIGEGKKTYEVNSYAGGKKRPVWFVFSGMGSQWAEMGTGIMKIPIIRESIERSHKILLPKGIDLISLITSTDPTIFDNILHAFVGIAAIQVALVDLLEVIGIKPEGIVGHSVGELGCSYGDKCLTAEQVMLAAYARGKASNEAKLIRGMMAAVGKSYADIKDQLPAEIEVACHNSKSSCTLSGPAEIMETYVGELKSKGVFAKLVNVANIAYHSKNIKPAAPYLLKYLKEIIPEPKQRSSKWISSSVPEAQWDTESAKYCSAEYHTNNLLGYVLFEEASAHVPADAICIEIAPHGLLQAIVKKSLATCTHVPLTNRTKKEGCFFLMEALGKLHLAGVDMDLSKLYPPVDYPVPRDMDYLHTILTWDHSELWVPLSLQLEVVSADPTLSWKDVKICSHVDDALNYVSNHRIRGEPFYLKSKVLRYMMEFMAEKAESKETSFTCYDFRNLNFLMDIPFDKGAESKIQILHQGGTGAFEALLNNVTIIKGYLNLNPSPLPQSRINEDALKNAKNPILINENHIYEYFEENEMIFKAAFRNIVSLSICEKGFVGKVKWRGSLEFYLEAIIKLIMFYSSIQHDQPMNLLSLEHLIVDPALLPNQDEDIEVFYDTNLGIISATGVRVFLFRTIPFPSRPTIELDVKNRQFVPYSLIDPKIEFTEFCLQILRENVSDEKLDLQLIIDEDSQMCQKVLENIYNEDLLASKINIRVRTTVTDATAGKGLNGYYMIIAENKLHNIVETLINSSIPFFFIHCGDQKFLEKNVDINKLSPIIQQNFQSKKLSFYKKRKFNLNDNVFINISIDNFTKEVTKIKDDKLSTTYFILMNYRMISDIATVLQTPLNINLSNKRFIFIDDAAPPFDPNNAYYKEQLTKDLTINISLNNVWGSLRDKSIPLSTVSTDQIISSEIPLNNIKCKNVDLKVVGVNLQNVVSPKKYKKFGVIDFAGLMGDKEVFGLGRLTDDNYLDVDPKLCWKKPSKWTMEEAVTTPLFYIMAYDMLYIQGKYTNRPYSSVLVHGGHTPFSQAVIHVAISMDAKVYTTCSTEEQKRFILKTFPQIQETNVYLINKTNRYTFADELLEQTEGKGVKIIIDCFESDELRTQTLQCAGSMATYFFVTNNDMDAKHTFGMGIFLRETAVIGYNPELVFEMSEQKKIALGGLLEAGISSHFVKPLNSFKVQNKILRDEAVDIIVTNSNGAVAKKVIIPIEKTDKKKRDVGIKEIIDKKHYMIVGTYNSLWFDIMKWLVSRGADCINIIINQDDIQPYLLKRYNHFMQHHKYVTIMFTGTESINNAQNCNQFIKKFQNGNSIDTVFYIKPGFEKQMTNIDYALRTYSKGSCLVSIGLQACRVTERRRNDQFKGVSFLLAKANLRNNMIVGVLDNWLKKSDENDDVIVIDKKKTDDHMVSRYSDTLPSNGSELYDLVSSAVEIPCLTEMPSKCPQRDYNRELDPVIVFPGFKQAQMELLISQLLYPSFMAKYPLKITSLQDLAAKFAKIICDSFNNYMFTLIAEGWSGPLVLSIAKLLEDRGKITEVILLDGAPNTIKSWFKHLDKVNNVISKYMPSIKEGENVSINDLKTWAAKMSVTISREEDGIFSPDEVRQGFDVMIQRLELAEKFSTKDIILNSSVHIFTPDTVDNDTTDLKKLCGKTFHQHILDDLLPSQLFLEAKSLRDDVCNLVLLEYKSAANKQNVAFISTLDVIMDAKFNSCGLSRV